MKQVTRHIAIPAIAPAVFFAIAATPVEVFGCRNRGLLALLAVFVSFIGAFGAAAVGACRRARGDSDSRWWVASAVLLAVPAVALLFLA